MIGMYENLKGNVLSYFKEQETKLKKDIDSKKLQT